MTTLPENPTGEQITAAIRAHAEASGTPLYTLVRQLSEYPNRWLTQLEAAQKPKPATIARVEALLRGDPVPPPPENRIWSRATPHRFPFEHRTVAEVMPPPAPPPTQPRRPTPSSPVFISFDRRPPAASREPCPRCAVRGDIGCAHQAPYESQAA